MIPKPSKRPKNRGALAWARRKAQWRVDHPADGWPPGWTCLWCGQRIDEADLDVDHIQDRSVAPDLIYEDSNLGPIHKWCNGDKKRSGVGARRW